MSGHSKWATIRRAKAITDSKRGKIFTKLAHNIIVAAQQGGADPDTNFSLRLAINRAKAENVPSDNIERAIKRGSGELKDTQIFTVTYEALGPGACAILIDCQTDNTNRALTDIRQIVERAGYKLGPSNSVSWSFQERGLIVLAAQKYVESAKFGKEGSYEPVSADDMELELMELPGVIDISQSTDEDNKTIVEVLTQRESFKTVHAAVMQAGYKIESAEMAKVSKEEVALNEEEWEQLQQLLETLDDSDEVTNVWHNAVQK